jgi:hypothetical protein
MLKHSKNVVGAAEIVCFFPEFEKIRFNMPTCPPPFSNFHMPGLINPPSVFPISNSRCVSRKIVGNQMTK